MSSLLRMRLHLFGLGVMMGVLGCSSIAAVIITIISMVLVLFVVRWYGADENHSFGVSSMCYLLGLTASAGAIFFFSRAPLSATWTIYFSVLAAGFILNLILGWFKVPSLPD